MVTFLMEVGVKILGNLESGNRQNFFFPLHHAIIIEHSTEKK